MDDSDASPISESEVLEGSVASAAAIGGAAPEFIRLPECETTAANEPDGYWQRRGKCSARRRIRQYYVTGTTTWKGNTITDERALARFFDPQVIFQVQTKLHIHRSWRIPVKTTKTEPTQQTQVNELSITSWNPDTLNHGKLERFLTYFDADIIIFQGTRLRMRTIPRDGKAMDDTITPVRSEWSSRGYQIFHGDGTMESAATMRAVCSLPFVRRRLELDRLCRGTTRRDRWQAGLEESG